MAVTNVTQMIDNLNKGKSGPYGKTVFCVPRANPMDTAIIWKIAVLSLKYMFKFILPMAVFQENIE